MKNPVIGLAVMGLLSAAIAVAPLAGWAQENQQPEAEKKEAPAKKKKDTVPFNGKVSALDKTAKTITVGERKYQVTSQTRIRKAGKPATLEDAVVGEEVAGAYRKAEDGKLNLASVRFGPRPEGEPKGEKKKKQAAE